MTERLNQIRRNFELDDGGTLTIQVSALGQIHIQSYTVFSRDEFQRFLNAGALLLADIDAHERRVCTSR